MSNLKKGVYWRAITRQSYSFTKTTSVPMGGAITKIAAGFTPNFTVQLRDALKIVHFFGACRDPSSTGNLSCKSFNIQIYATTQSVAGWQANAAAYEMGDGGVVASIDDAPLMLGTDFIEANNALSQGFSFGGVADVVNSDGAANHDAVINGTVLYEIWRSVSTPWQG
jgi:hypothetical protein